MYTTSDIVEIGAAQDLILSLAKWFAQFDDDCFWSMYAEDLDE